MDSYENREISPEIMAMVRERLNRLHKTPDRLIKLREENKARYIASEKRRIERELEERDEKKIEIKKKRDKKEENKKKEEKE